MSNVTSLISSHFYTYITLCSSMNESPMPSLKISWFKNGSQIFTLLDPSAKLMLAIGYSILLQ